MLEKDINIIEKLKSLKRYDVYHRDCSCCNGFITSDEYEYGEWIKSEDINQIINELENKQNESNKLS